MIVREVKFRAWHKEHGSMATWEEINILDEDGLYPFLEMLNGKLYEVMQYTGLKDRNGVEIYEGDIINHHGGYSSDELILCRWQEALVSGDWTMEKPGFRFERINGTGTTIWIADKHFEVIGNIYSTPHLLPKEEEPT